MFALGGVEAKGRKEKQRRGVEDERRKEQSTISQIIGPYLLII